MSDILTKVKEKQETIHELQRSAAKQAGSREQLLKRLKDEFEVDSLEEAQKYLKELENEKSKNEKVLEEYDSELKKIISSAKKGNNPDS